MKKLLGLSLVLAVAALAGCGKCSSCGDDKACCPKEGDGKTCGKDCTKPCCNPPKK